MTFKEVYKFPLKVDEYCDIITWTADKQRAFDWLINATLEQKQQLVDVINGTNSDKRFKNQFYREGIHIYSKASELKEVPILRVRGWGYLTGIGGLHLPQEEAIKIQDEFGDYIVEQLNKNHENI
jgi:hypothetical protein